MGVDAAQLLLATYLFHKKELKQKNGRPLQPKTLVNHLNAAHAYLQQVLRMEIPLRQPTGKSTKLLPIFGDTIALSQKWSQPKPKREAFTWEIFLALQEMVREACQDDLTCFLDLIPTVFDWLCLGVFTGSRAGEYAQTVANRGEYSKVPTDNAAGAWQGYAVAFVLEDFVYLDSKRRILPTNWDTLNRKHKVFELQVRFRYDKSKDNFTIRKFRRTDSFLCPVEASLSIVRRALLLQVPPKAPLGVHRWNEEGHFTYLRSDDLIKVVREACTRAYPDPNHFLRVHEDRLVAHSNRVTAAVALWEQKWSIERIADRLRWTKESVKHYLRECSHSIGEMTLAAINGAQVLG